LPPSRFNSPTIIRAHPSLTTINKERRKRRRREVRRDVKKGKGKEEGKREEEKRSRSSKSFPSFPWMALREDLHLSRNIFSPASILHPRKPFLPYPRPSKDARSPSSAPSTFHFPFVELLADLCLSLLPSQPPSSLDLAVSPLPNMATSTLPAVLNATEEDIQLLLSAQCHIGSKNCDKSMEPYVWKRRADGESLSSLLSSLSFSGRSRAA